MSLDAVARRSCLYGITDEFKAIYDCALCPSLCSSQKEFQDHIQEEHRSNFLPCITCGKLYSSSKCLIQHIDTAHKPFLYCCGKDGCRFRTTVFKTFLFHIVKCVSSDFPCYSCKTTFSTPESLIAHMGNNLYVERGNAAISSQNSPSQSPPVQGEILVGISTAGPANAGEKFSHTSLSQMQSSPHVSVSLPVQNTITSSKFSPLIISSTQENSNAFKDKIVKVVSSCNNPMLMNHWSQKHLLPKLRTGQVPHAPLHHPPRPPIPSQNKTSATKAPPLQAFTLNQGLMRGKVIIVKQPSQTVRNSTGVPFRPQGSIGVPNLVNRQNPTSNSKHVKVIEAFEIFNTKQPRPQSTAFQNTNMNSIITSQSNVKKPQIIYCPAGKLPTLPTKHVMPAPNAKHVFLRPINRQVPNQQGKPMPKMIYVSHKQPTPQMARCMQIGQINSTVLCKNDRELPTIGQVGSEQDIIASLSGTKKALKNSQSSSVNSELNAASSSEFAVKIDHTVSLAAPKPNESADELILPNTGNYILERLNTNVKAGVSVDGEPGIQISQSSSNPFSDHTYVFSNALPPPVKIIQNEKSHNGMKTESEAILAQFRNSIKGSEYNKQKSVMTNNFVAEGSYENYSFAGSSKEPVNFLKISNVFSHQEINKQYKNAVAHSPILSKKPREKKSKRKRSRSALVPRKGNFGINRSGSVKRAKYTKLEDDSESTTTPTTTDSENFTSDEENDKNLTPAVNKVHYLRSFGGRRLGHSFAYCNLIPKSSKEEIHIEFFPDTCDEVCEICDGSSSIGETYEKGNPCEIEDDSSSSSSITQLTCVPDIEAFYDSSADNDIPPLIIDDDESTMSAVFPDNSNAETTYPGGECSKSDLNTHCINDDEKGEGSRKDTISNDSPLTVREIIDMFKCDSQSSNNSSKSQNKYLKMLPPSQNCDIFDSSCEKTFLTAAKSVEEHPIINHVISMRDNSSSFDAKLSKASTVRVLSPVLVSNTKIGLYNEKDAKVAVSMPKLIKETLNVNSIPTASPFMFVDEPDSFLSHPEEFFQMMPSSAKVANGIVTLSIPDLQLDETDSGTHPFKDQNVDSCERFKDISHYISYLRNRKTERGVTKMAASSDFFKCMLQRCLFTSNSLSEFSSHFSKHKEALLECPYCLAQLDSVDSLLSHSVRFHRKRIYQCSLCFFRACTQIHIQFHIHNHHVELIGEVLIGTPISTELAKIPGDLPKFHFEITTIPCAFPECSFSSNSITDISLHMMDHKELPCMRCDSQSSTVLKWINHLRSHNIYLLQCLFCRYGCNKRLLMLNHLVVHHADYPLMTYVRTSEKLLFIFENCLNNVKKIPFVGIQCCQSPSTCYCYLLQCPEFEGSCNRIRSFIENVKIKKLHFKQFDCLYCDYQSRTIVKMENHLLNDHSFDDRLRYYYCTSQKLSNTELKDIFHFESVCVIKRPQARKKMHLHTKLCEERGPNYNHLKLQISEIPRTFSIEKLKHTALRNYLAQGKYEMKYVKNSSPVIVISLPSSSKEKMFSQITKSFHHFLKGKSQKLLSFHCTYCTNQYPTLKNLRVHWKISHVKAGKRFSYRIETHSPHIDEAFDCNLSDASLPNDETMAINDLLESKGDSSLGGYVAESGNLYDRVKRNRAKIHSDTEILLTRSQKLCTNKRSDQWPVKKKTKVEFFVSRSSLSFFARNPIFQKIRSLTHQEEVKRLQSTKMIVALDGVAFPVKIPSSYLEPLVNLFPSVSLSDVRTDIFKNKQKSSSAKNTKKC